MLTTNELGGEHTTRTPLLGATLSEMLNFTSDNATKPPPDSPKSDIYEALRPKYDNTEVREKIERNCQFNSIKPHLIDVSVAIRLNDKPNPGLRCLMQEQARRQEPTSNEVGSTHY